MKINNIFADPAQPTAGSASIRNAALLRQTSAARASAGVQADQAPPEAMAVVDFWRAAGPAMWFARDAAFDADFRDRFIALHEAATRGDLVGWSASPRGALALLILLDQFPRNAFRGTPRMYSTDQLARAMADKAIYAGHDALVDQALSLFFYLPFAHSERREDQERSVMLARNLPPPIPDHAARHQDIIRRFGRFPHRNAILRRRSTAEETAYLASGGYSG